MLVIWWAEDVGEELFEVGTFRVSGAIAGAAVQECAVEIHDDE